MSYNDQNQNPDQQSLDNVKKASRPITNKGVGAAKRLAAKTGKAAVNVIAGLIKASAPWLLGALAIIFFAWLSFNLIFEWRGPEREYYQREENPATYSESEGIYRTDEGEITEKNEIIRDFYKYYGETSVWKLSGADKTDFMDRDGKEYAETKDFHEREELYALNNHMLIALDDFLYDEEIRNPDQFIRPVNHDPDTLTLKPINDSEGNIIVDSDVIDLETGVKTGETIKSMRDYGLASILVYNEKEEYTRTLKIIGKYDTEDYWDSSINDVRTRAINEPIEGLVLDGYPESIDLIDKAITFAGEVEYTYEYQDVELSGMMGGSTSKENTPYRSYHYDTYYQEVNCRQEWTGEYHEFTGDEIKERVCDTIPHKLYKHRSDDTKLYQYIPVETEIITSEDTSEYFRNYVMNFESYVHIDNVGEDNLFDKINYDSFVFEDEASLDNDAPFEMGTAKDTVKYEKSAAYYKDIKVYTDMFGIDPRIIIAMIAQESGGKADISKGLAQITYISGEITKDARAKDINGNTVSIKVKKNQVNDPEIAIKYMVVRYAELLQIYNGDPLKAMQAYNFGPGTMDTVKRVSGSNWDTKYGWMNYLEAARREQSPNSQSASYRCMIDPGYNSSVKKWGDSCYTYNVLQYYDGDKIEAPKSISQRLTGFVSSMIEDLFPVSDKPKLGKHEEFIPLIHETIPDDIIGITTAFNNQSLFSDVGEFESMNFYNIGFFQMVNSPTQRFYDVVNMTPGGKGFIWPAPADISTVSSKYGYRIHPIFKDRRLHTGIDIPVPTGRSIYAVADGTIVRAEYAGGYGYLVSINHGNGVETRYAHNSRMLVKAGDRVSQGQAVALAGSTGNSTGPHLHFEVRVSGSPVDPLPWIRN